MLSEATSKRTSSRRNPAAEELLDLYKSNHLSGEAAKMLKKDHKPIKLTLSSSSPNAKLEVSEVLNSIESSTSLDQVEIMKDNHDDIDQDPPRKRMTGKRKREVPTDLEKDKIPKMIINLNTNKASSYSSFDDAKSDFELFKGDLQETASSFDEFKSENSDSSSSAEALKLTTDVPNTNTIKPRPLKEDNKKKSVAFELQSDANLTEDKVKDALSKLEDDFKTSRIELAQKNIAKLDNEIELIKQNIYPELLSKAAELEGKYNELLNMCQIRHKLELQCIMNHFEASKRVIDDEDKAIQKELVAELQILVYKNEMGQHTTTQSLSDSHDSDLKRPLSEKRIEYDVFIGLKPHALYDDLKRMNLSIAPKATPSQHEATSLTNTSKSTISTYENETSRSIQNSSPLPVNLYSDEILDSVIPTEDAPFDTSPPDGYFDVYSHQGKMVYNKRDYYVNDYVQVSTLDEPKFKATIKNIGNNEFLVKNDDGMNSFIHFNDLKSGKYFMQKIS